VEPDISVILPVYRNAAVLDDLYLQLVSALELLGSPFELLFVDDASPDRSLTVLRRLATVDERVAVLALPENVGQNRAVMAGLAYARGEVAVVMDADLQDPPAALPALLGHLRQSDAAAVFAGRRGRYERLSRRLSSRLFKGLLHLLTIGRLPADAGLFVAMRREMVEQLLSYDVSTPYVVGLMARGGLPLISIPVERAPAERSGYTAGMRLCLSLLALRTIAGPIRQRQAQPDTVPAELIGSRFSGAVSRQDTGRHSR
jgi:glycosyltransferase involved in cell wall biosynthesis